ncbi:hypothetical protein [Nocardia sp. NPDC060249]|uniref:hypothetical protein n=1 Tax=Nocardia sp. NPDC060249 TaxID=3347082 RepID=UPI00364F20D8
MWLYAVWGMVGAAVNCGLVFLEATQRSKGWPWARPEGPGGVIYAVSIAIQLLIAGATASVVLGSGLVAPNILVAFGIGTGTPVVVKKLSAYVQSLLPGDDESDGSEQ